MSKKMYHSWLLVNELTQFAIIYKYVGKMQYLIINDCKPMVNVSVWNCNAARKREDRGMIMGLTVNQSIWTVGNKTGSTQIFYNDKQNR